MVARVIWVVARAVARVFRVVARGVPGWLPRVLLGGYWVFWVVARALLGCSGWLLGCC